MRSPPANAEHRKTFSQFCRGCRVPLQPEHVGQYCHCETCRKWLDVSRGISMVSAALRELRK
jgi:hypothetical protein